MRGKARAHATRSSHCAFPVRWGHTAAALLFAVALLLPTLAGEAGAQEPDPGTPVLTLQEAIDRALRNNPAFRRTTNELGLNTVEYRSAWLDLLPTMNVNALSTNMTWNRTPIAEDVFGNPLENPETGMIRSSQTGQGGSLFFTFDFTNVLRLRQQSIQAETRELSVLTQEHQLRSDIAQSFLDLQERQLSIELEEELLGNAESNLAVVEQLFNLARRDRIDVIGARLEVAERESALESARSELNRAQLELRNLIGDPQLTEFRVDPSPLPAVDPAALEEDVLVAVALADGPQVRQAERSLAIQQRNRGIERANWLPTVSLSLSTSRTSAARERDVFDQDGNLVRSFQGDEAFFDLNPGVDWGRNVSLMFSFPNLGTYFDRRNQSAQTDIQIRNEQETLRETRLEVEQQVRTLVVELRTNRRELELQERRAELAEEQLALQLEQYRLGEGTFLDLQTVSESAAQARRSALQARFNLERSRVNLERALGMPLDRILGTDGGR